MNIKHAIQLMRLDKPIGIFLLLWPTLWALWLASAGKPHWSIVVIFILGVVLMRSAGCVINDIADRHIDKYVARTYSRPLTAGKISTRAALLLFAALLCAAFLLVLLLNRLTVFLALVGAALAVIYPFLKRITHLPQFGLGLAFSWGIPMAFAAQNNAVPAVAWELFAASAVWIVMYDTLYAMVDRDDDVKIGVKSTAILFGRYDCVLIGVLQVLFLLLLMDLGHAYHLGQYYFSSVLAAGLLFVYQQYLIKDRVPAACFKAFLNNHWVGLIIFLGIAS